MPPDSDHSFVAVSAGPNHLANRTIFLRVVLYTDMSPLLTSAFLRGKELSHRSRRKTIGTQEKATAVAPVGFHP